MGSAETFSAYLNAFTSGDLDAAMSLIDDNFVFEGPILQSTGKDTFVEGSATAAKMARGVKMLRQFEDDAEVVSIYKFELGAPATPGSVLMMEWTTVRDGKLVSSRLVFDTAQFAALMPQA